MKIKFCSNCTYNVSNVVIDDIYLCTSCSIAYEKLRVLTVDCFVCKTRVKYIESYTYNENKKQIQKVFNIINIGDKYYSLEVLCGTYCNSCVVDANNDFEKIIQNQKIEIINKNQKRLESEIKNTNNINNKLLEEINSLKDTLTARDKLYDKIFDNYEDALSKKQNKPYERKLTVLEESMKNSPPPIVPNLGLSAGMGDGVVYGYR